MFRTRCLQTNDPPSLEYRRWTALIAVLLLICLSASPATAQNYEVGKGDVLKITVYEHKDLTATVRVSDEGTIIMPLLGQVEVDDLSVSGVAEKLAGLLADGYIVNPQVSVFVEEFRSKKAVILGQVMKPGLYELRGPTTLLELISKAAGLTEDTGDRAIIKRHRPNEEEKVILIDMKRLVEEGDTSLNIPVMDGDSIYISKAGLFYVTGEVRKPDAYRYEEETTVIKAITMAGGFDDKAAPGKVNIIRKIDGREEVLKKVNMDATVLPDDVIVVPESFF